MHLPQNRPEVADPNELEFSLLENSTVVAAILATPEGVIVGSNDKMRAVLGGFSRQALHGHSSRSR